MSCHEFKRANGTSQDSRSKASFSPRVRNIGQKIRNLEQKYDVASITACHNQPSTSALHTETETEKAKQLLPFIIFNDLIMAVTISNLANFQDRINMEKTCRYFNKLCKYAPRKFTRLKNDLKLTYFALGTNITFEHGNLKFKRPSMTLVDRRETLGPRNRQKKEFLDTLKGIARRFGKSIKRLSIGGTDETARMYGIGDHQLIITEDVIQILFEQYNEIEELTFKNCGFDKDAVNFINNYQGPIFTKLRHLGLISIWCDGDAPPYMLMKIAQTLTLRTLTADYLKIENNIGEALMQSLEGRGVRLEQIQVTVANYFRVQPIDVQRYLRSLSRSAEKIEIRLMGNYDDASPALIAGLQLSVELRNLTGLVMNHFPQNRNENCDYDEAVRGLRNGNRLTSLTLNGWQDPDIIRSVTVSLTGAFLLESLVLRNLPVDTNSQHLTKLFEVLKVVNIELGSIPCMDSSHLRTLCKKVPYLETLRLKQVPKVSSHCVEQCLKKWRKLKWFDIETALSSECVDILCNRKYLPHLRSAFFWMIVDQQKRSSMEKLLQHFEIVDCWTNGAPERYCRVSVRNPRSTPISLISDAAVTYCHADHHPRKHEPSPPRQRWDFCPPPYSNHKSRPKVN